MNNNVMYLTTRVGLTRGFDLTVDIGQDFVDEAPICSVRLLELFDDFIDAASNPSGETDAIDIEALQSLVDSLRARVDTLVPRSEQTE